MSVSPSGFLDILNVTLVDEDTNSCLADDTNGAISGNAAMQEALPGG